MTRAKISRLMETGFPQPVRDLPLGTHPLLAILPEALKSPALTRIGSDRFPGRLILENAKVSLVSRSGFCWVDETVPCIVLTRSHYRRGSDLDLYLDLIHEATHLRQVLEGRDVWDETLPYHQRPTEIEGYAVAVAECLRLGLNEDAIRDHLTNPWMSDVEVAELQTAINAFLARTHGEPIP